MSSVECLRTFVIERLTVAAEEIFRVFQQKIDGYEDEVEYQRRLVESVWRPKIKLHRKEFSQQRLCKEEEDTYQHQDRSCSLDQEDLKPPQIKDQEENRYNQDREQMAVKQEMDTFMVIPIHEEDNHNDLDLNPDQSEEKRELNITVQTSVLPAPDCDLQLLSNSPRIAESNYQENYNSEDSRLMTNDVSKQSMKQNSHKCHTGNGHNPAVDCHTDTGTTSSPCNTGKQQVKCKSDLTGHLTRNTHDNAHVNSTCRKGSRGGSFPSAHNKSDTGTRPFHCETCGKDFKLATQLKGHVKIHTGERPHFCKTCGKTFIYKCQLNFHMKVHTDNKPHVCKTCGKTFRLRSELNKHISVHTGERPYSCHTCGKAFKQDFSLIRHMSVHTCERPYLCKICGKTFKQFSTLSVHMSIHTGDRPYVCNTCGKTFNRQSALNTHMRIHAGEKPYVCKTCGKALRYLSSVSHHMKIHTGEKAHVCESCGKAFRHNVELKRHMKVHTGESPFVCKPCGKGFKHYPSLRRHMNLHTCM